MLEIDRILEFDAGHRILGHEHLCRYPHGHRYKVIITISGKLDRLGRVLDFGFIKQICRDWLDSNLDHAFIVYRHDTELLSALMKVDSKLYIFEKNPTAENLAAHLLEKFQSLLPDNKIIRVKLYETPNCSATAYA